MLKGLPCQVFCVQLFICLLATWLVYLKDYIYIKGDWQTPLSKVTYSYKKEHLSQERNHTISRTIK